MITQRILSLLEEKSLTATDLCRAIGINTSTMTNWKNRGTDPPAKMIIPICEFLLTGIEQEYRCSEFESEVLSLFRSLPHDAQLEFRGELKGYIKCLKRQEEDAAEPLKKAK